MDLNTNTAKAEPLYNKPLDVNTASFAKKLYDKGLDEFAIAVASPVVTTFYKGPDSWK